MSTPLKQNSSPTQIGTPSEREIRIERTFDAARERVWRAFTDPEQLAQWWGRGNKLVVERFELQRGGHYRFVEHTSAGPQGFEGRFREVTPMERLVQSFEWDGMPAHVAIKTIEFVDLGAGRTKVVTTLSLHTPEERDGMLHSGMEPGMNKSYAELDKLLARAA